MKFLYIAYLVCVSSLPTSSLLEQHIKPTNQSAVGSLFGLLGTSLSTKADQGPIAHDCNCGNRVDQWATGKQSVEKCRAECLKNENCLSFGLWTNMDKGHCALFDQICTHPCPNPTSSSTGYRNDVYNVNKGDLDGGIIHAIDKINTRLDINEKTLDYLFFTTEQNKMKLRTIEDELNKMK